jgi:sugar phosphate isomerase/epimerase
MGIKLINRRAFLQQSGVIAAGMMIAPSLAFTPHKQAGIQLYTLGDLGKDVKGGMQKVAKAGYQLVETSGYTEAGKFWGMDAATFKGVLKANGLQSPSGLYGIDLKGNFEDLKHFIEAANIVGQQYLVMPWLFEEWRKSADDYKIIAQKLNEAGELTRKAGIQMAYHNHDFEFKDFDRQTGYDILLKETDPQLVKMEMDIYWIVRGGGDPVTLFKKYPGRFALWHVKDMDKKDSKLNTEVGTGSIDFKKIFAHAKLAGMDYAFVEQENFKMDPYQSIAQSAAYLKHTLLK